MKEGQPSRKKPGPKTTREAKCLNCGKDFTSKKRVMVWTYYCSTCSKKKPWFKHRFSNAKIN